MKGSVSSGFPRPALAVGKQIEPGAGVPRQGAEDMSPVEWVFLCAHPFLLGLCDVDFLWTKSRGGHPLSRFSGPAQSPSPLRLHGATGGCETGRSVVARSPGVLAGPGPLCTQATSPHAWPPLTKAWCPPPSQDSHPSGLTLVLVGTPPAGTREPSQRAERDVDGD